MSSITRLDQIVQFIEVYDAHGEIFEVPVKNLENISPDPFFPNIKFDFDLETLKGKLNKTFGFRLYHVLLSSAIVKLCSSHWPYKETEFDRFYYKI